MVYVFVCSIVNYDTNTSSNGIWLILMFEITNNALLYPDSDLNIFNISVNFKLYPVLLVFTYMIINLAVFPIEPIIGILISVCYNVNIVKNTIGEVSDNIVQNLEDFFIFNLLKHYQGKISENLNYI